MVKMIEKNNLEDKISETRIEREKANVSEQNYIINLTQTFLGTIILGYGSYLIYELIEKYVK